LIFNYNTAFIHLWSAKNRSAFYPLVRTCGPQVSGPHFTHPLVRRSASPQVRILPMPSRILLLTASRVHGHLTACNKYKSVMYHYGVSEISSASNCCNE